MCVSCLIRHIVQDLLGLVSTNTLLRFLQLGKNVLAVSVWGYCPTAYRAILEEKLMAVTKNLRIRSTFQSGNNDKHTARKYD